jgi:hypothetical protein
VIPFVSLRTLEVPHGFPQRLSDINHMPGRLLRALSVMEADCLYLAQDAARILSELGQDVNGSLADRRRRLKMTLGITLQIV